MERRDFDILLNIFFFSWSWLWKMYCVTAHAEAELSHEMSHKGFFLLRFQMNRSWFYFCSPSVLVALYSLTHKYLDSCFNHNCWYWVSSLKMLNLLLVYFRFVSLVNVMHASLGWDQAIDLTVEEHSSSWLSRTLEGFRWSALRNAVLSVNLLSNFFCPNCSVLFSLNNALGH